MRKVKRAIELFDKMLEKNTNIDFTVKELEQVTSINDNWYYMMLNGMKAAFIWGYEYAKREGAKK